MNYFICTSYWNSLFYHSVALEISIRINELNPINTYGTAILGTNITSVMDWLDDIVTKIKHVSSKRIHKKLKKIYLENLTL